MQDLTDRIRHIRDALTAGLVGRDLAIRLALLAALAGEHLLLIGPPGTAKSLVARRLHLAFADSAYFERLLTRFSVPEELFGPLSIKGLEEDRYERLTKSYLPTASIAFLDEIFKANSAILNALLTLLNEREFDNGAERVATPLMAVVGASNELPESAELDALFDRFLLRLHLAPVSRQEFPNLLRLRDNVLPVLRDGAKLTHRDLEELQQAAADVDVPDDVLALLGHLREWCNAESVFVSDRRWRKVLKLLQTSALTNGRNKVSIWDCWLLQHCLWSDAGERGKIYDWYATRVGAVSEEPTQLVRLVNGWERRLEKDKSGRSQKQDPKGKFLFDRGDGKPTTNSKGQAYRRGSPLFTLQNATRSYNRDKVDATNSGRGYTKTEIEKMDDLHVAGHHGHFARVLDDYFKDRNNWFTIDYEPLMESTKHKSVYIEHVKTVLQELRSRLTAHRASVDRQAASLQDDVRNHLWVTDDFVEPASQGLGKAKRDVEELLGRLAEVADRFEALPREEEDLPP